MPKAPVSVTLPEYAPVADRLLLFWARFPDGRIETQLVTRTPEEVVFRAAVYRRQEDRRPAATGWAAEREGDGEINTVACLENTETSAVGRALANLGFTAGRQRPSAEEMAKAGRARAALAQVSRHVSADIATRGSVATRGPSLGPSRADIADGGHSDGGSGDLSTSRDLQARADALADVLHLLRRAERAGLRPARVAAFRTRLVRGHASPDVLAAMSRMLRHWVDNRRDELLLTTS